MEKIYNVRTQFLSMNRESWEETKSQRISKLKESALAVNTRQSLIQLMGV